jgi:hypothetical protein
MEVGLTAGISANEMGREYYPADCPIRAIRNAVGYR